MSLEMLTDVNDGDVDEEVITKLLSSLTLSSSPFNPHPKLKTNLAFFLQMESSLTSILSLHTRKILHYKRLLERSQASSAAQLHALQAQVNLLRDSSSLSSGTRRLSFGSGPGGEGEAHDGLCVCGGQKKKKRGYWSGYRDSDDDDEEEDSCKEKGTSKALVKALKGDAKGGFNEIEVRRVVRGLGREERMRL